MNGQLAQEGRSARTRPQLQELKIEVDAGPTELLALPLTDLLECSPSQLSDESEETDSAHVTDRESPVNMRRRLASIDLSKDCENVRVEPVELLKRESLHASHQQVTSPSSWGKIRTAFSSFRTPAELPNRRPPRSAPSRRSKQRFWTAKSASEICFDRPQPPSKRGAPWSAPAGRFRARMSSVPTIKRENPADLQNSPERRLSVPLGSARRKNLRSSFTEAECPRCSLQVTCLSPQREESGDECECSDQQPVVTSDLRRRFSFSSPFRRHSNSEFETRASSWRTLSSSRLTDDWSARAAEEPRVTRPNAVMRTRSQPDSSKGVAHTHRTRTRVGEIASRRMSPARHRRMVHYESDLEVNSPPTSPRHLEHWAMHDAASQTEIDVWVSRRTVKMVSVATQTD